MDSFKTGLTDITDPRSVGARLRARRWSQFIRAFPNLRRMRVLDLGGEISAWRLAPVRPAELVLLNLPPVTDFEGEAGWATRVIGDACDPPTDLDGERFDLVYSNSVIEHVGGHTRRIALANSVRRFADRYWVQTPYRFFPVEQHTLVPLMQFLPVAARSRIVRIWPLGNVRQTYKGSPQTAGGRERYQLDSEPQRLRDVSIYHATRNVLSIELLSVTEMQFLFCDAKIIRERLAGLTKSIIAFRA